MAGGPPTTAEQRHRLSQIGNVSSELVLYGGSSGSVHGSCSADLLHALGGRGVLPSQTSHPNNANAGTFPLLLLGFTACLHPLQKLSHILFSHARATSAMPCLLQTRVSYVLVLRSPAVCKLALFAKASVSFPMMRYLLHMRIRGSHSYSALLMLPLCSGGLPLLHRGADLPDGPQARPSPHDQLQRQSSSTGLSGKQHTSHLVDQHPWHQTGGHYL